MELQKLKLAHDAEASAARAAAEVRQSELAAAAAEEAQREAAARAEQEDTERQVADARMAEMQVLTV